MAPVGPQPPATPPQPSAEMRKVAEEFEANFLFELMAPIFETLDTEGLGGGGSGERAFRPMLVQEYTRQLARTGGVGVADAVARELLKLQEGGGA